MDHRRKRLLFRCQHCGMRENDILIGGFAAAHVNDLSDGQMDSLESLLKEVDTDLCSWITGKEPVPGKHDNDIMAWLKKFNNCP